MPRKKILCGTAIFAVVPAGVSPAG